MILTNEEIEQIHLSLEERSGLDEELLKRCGHLIHIGAFDEAVRNAFVLLEERLRKATGQEGMTGTNLANLAFNADGHLSKQLSDNPAEREGLRELYSGAFKLFRNPTAHGIVGYDSAEGKSIIALVSLLIGFLDKVEGLPPADLLPANAVQVITGVDKLLGAGAASRLRTFVSKCVMLGLKPAPKTTQWIPFRRQGLMKYDDWDKPRPHNFAMFYLVVGAKDHVIQFPVGQYYRLVVGFDLEAFKLQLQELAFHPVGQQAYYTADIRLHNDAEFFKRLTELVKKTIAQIDRTLT